MNYTDFEKKRKEAISFSKMHGYLVPMPEEERQYILDLSDFYEEYLQNMRVSDFVRIVKSIVEENEQQTFIIEKKKEVKNFFYTAAQREKKDNPDYISEIAMPEISGSPERFYVRTIQLERLFIIPKDRSNEPVEVGHLFVNNPELNTIGKTRININHILLNLSDEYENGEQIIGAIQNKIFQKAENKYRQLIGKGIIQE